MTKLHSNRWAELSPYLDEALELDPQQRESWLAALESTQPLLAAELRELLALDAANRASGFLERSPLRNDESLAGRQSAPTPSNDCWVAAGWGACGWRVVAMASSRAV